MTIDPARGLKLGAIGALCFLAAPLLVALGIALTMARSTGDPAGSAALGLGLVLLIAGNCAWAAILVLGGLAAMSVRASSGMAAAVGGSAGAAFAVAFLTVGGLKTALLMPLTAAVLVLASWLCWQRLLPRRR